MKADGGGDGRGPRENSLTRLIVPDLPISQGNRPVESLTESSRGTHNRRTQQRRQACLSGSGIAALLCTFPVLVHDRADVPVQPGRAPFNLLAHERYKSLSQRDGVGNHLHEAGCCIEGRRVAAPFNHMRSRRGDGRG